MRVAERKDTPEGAFVLDPHDELAACIAHVICNDSLDFPSPYQPSEGGMTLEETLCDPGPAIENLAIELADMASCVERMDCRQRTVLYNMLTGWSAKEIAKRLGITRGRVYVARTGAIAILRKHYGHRNP